MERFAWRPWVMLLPAWLVFWMFDRMRLGPFRWHGHHAWRISNDYIIVKYPVGGKMPEAKQ